MIRLLRTVPLRKQGEMLVPFLLAALVVVIGALVYFELVGVVLEYAN